MTLKVKIDVVTLFVIIALIFVVILLLAIYTLNMITCKGQSPDWAKKIFDCREEYKITKTECHNETDWVVCWEEGKIVETQLIYPYEYKELDWDSDFLEMIYYFPEKFQLLNQTLLYAYYDFDCSEEFSNYTLLQTCRKYLNVSEILDLEITEKSGDYLYVESNSDKIYSLVYRIDYMMRHYCEEKEQQVCKQVEIEELEIEKTEVDSCSFACAYCTGDNVGIYCHNENGKIIIKNDSLNGFVNIVFEKIPASEINEEWLGENCLVYWCDFLDTKKENYAYFDEEFGNCDYFKSIQNEGFNKYKCGENYEVNVK